ncbi:hypothetical protein PORY_000933 [Pneumocystis oryctolagi]|uniref:Uncharacterized protein n=1 Tax=Pneumocystis oryctolagi TaxID=42067 RepID=A0ACB7CE68_9ASCO|nr:hypothetical protein PORY_000933 [Pneumocystis oryctolagi]
MQNPLAVPLSAVEAASFMAPSSLSFPSSHMLMSGAMYSGMQDEKGVGPGAAAAPLGSSLVGTFTGVSGIVPTLQNIVATVNLDCRLDLKTIALHARNAEYNPKRFAAVIMRIREPKTTALIFASGKMVVTGAKSEDDSKLASRKYARIIQKLGFNAKFTDFKIQNIVGSCDVKFPIRLEGLAYSHGTFSSYEPELFPGLIYRMVKPKIVLLIFVSGKIVLTGAKVREEIYQAFEAKEVEDAFSVAERWMRDVSVPLSELEAGLGRIMAVRDANRGARVLNHLSMVSEGAAALGWVVAGADAAKYIQDMKESAQFYADRVLKEKNTTETSWVHAYMKLLSELLVYVKEYYPTGFVRGSISSIDAQTPCVVNTVAAESLDTSLPEIKSPPLINIESVFAELSMGESITSKLRKVHQNPSSLQQQQKDVSKQLTDPTKDALSGNVITSHEKKEKLISRKILTGNRWTIENFENNDNVVIDCLEVAQTVYIFNCKKCTIHLKGKANAVYMDQSVNCGLIIDTLISSIEFTRCISLTFQVLDYTPTITLDQCSNCQIYLSPNCLNTEIITSKYDSINVHIPNAGCDGDYKECPVPEMLKSVVVNGMLVTSFVEHAG